MAAAEGTYEYECMRAELLGIPKPTLEEFQKSQAEKAATAQADPTETEKLEQVDADGEQMRHLTGGLEELSSILKVTQNKINKLKASCGTFNSFLRSRIGFGGGGSAASATESVDQPSQEDKDSGVQDVPGGSRSPRGDSSATEEGGDSDSYVSDSELTRDSAQKSDLTKALDNQGDKLDSLLDKAENAQYSMGAQTKEMRKFLN